MARYVCLTFAAAAARFGDAAVVTLASFDGATGTTFNFKELNDPVMGGKSTGTWTLDQAHKVGIFDGEVVNVPSLKAPGFIKAAADGKFPDASSAATGNLVLTVRSSTPDFKGFRVSVVSGAVSGAYACSGGGSLPFSRGCFKAKFAVPAGDSFSKVKIPFNMFSDKWSPATGEQTTTCAQDKDVCPTAKKLAAIQRLEVWAEGALGKVHLEIMSITAEVDSAVTRPSLAIAEDMPLVTFDGATGTTFKFAELNDPVMGGKSTGTVTLNSTGGLLVFDGQVVDVPALKAPGFIETHADGKFKDVSAGAGGDLVLLARSSVTYAGWKVSLASGAHSATFSCAGGGSLPFSRGCYKAPFALPAGDEFVEIRVPFSTFTDKWNSATGAPEASCQSDASTCLTGEKLKAIQRIEFMAEGVAGKVHLEVKAVSVAPPSTVIV